jgi:hypothetical protein
MKKSGLNYLIRRYAKRLFYLMLLMVLVACIPAPSHMLKNEGKLDITAVQPAPGKAALVVARTTIVGGGIELYNYIGHKFIGVTRGKGCFVKNDIEPGLQYLIVRNGSVKTGKILFEPDKVYYVSETPGRGYGWLWAFAHVTLEPVTPAQLLSEIDDGGCTYYEINKNDIAEELLENKYQKAVSDYERELKEGSHKEFTEYTGFKVKK